MGGGGMIRAAAKLTGVTVAPGSLRGISIEHLPVSSATRRAASVVPAAATVSSVDEVKLVASRPEKTFSEIDDWVFTGEEVETTIGSGDSFPRVVFDHVPTLRESKEATSELTTALEKICLPSNDSDRESSLSNKACVINGISMAASLSSPVHKAFRFLQQSPEAQNVVASIACDPNVWTAVMQNQELKEFIHSQKTEEDSVFYGSIDDDKNAAAEPGGGLTDWVSKIKVTVLGMMNRLTDYFAGFFGGHGSGGATESAAMKTVFGLVIMVIVTVLVKRR